MAGTGRILFERDGAIARLTLSQPARKNAISAGMWEDLARFCAGAADDRSLRAVVVTGAGAIFSAGADITGFEAGRSGTTATGYDDLVESTVSGFEALPQVVIAAVNGPCLGAGASLASACDFRVCDPAAWFAVPAARLGLGYDPRGIARFLRIFGEGATKEAILLAARIPAARAHALGAVHRLAEPGSAVAAATEMAAQAAALAPLTQAAAKAAIREIGRRPAPGAAVLAATAAADESDDYAEGRAAFAEKRPPVFRGQ